MPRLCLRVCTSSPQQLRRSRQQCFLRTPRDRLFHTPAPIIHLRKVSLLTSRPCCFANCSLANVGPKSCHSGCCTISSALRSTASAIRRFDARPRSPWTTTPSPSSSILASSRRTHRSVTPIRSDAYRCVTTPSWARFNHSSQSRSSWLIAIRSIPQPIGCQEELSTLPN